MTNEEYMREALKEAALAPESGDVPVGAVLVREGEILCRAHNEREARRSPSAHAEMLCIEEGCRLLGRKTLTDCTLFVTLEPCPMCAGAILGAKVGTVVFGAPDPAAGCFGSVFDFASAPLGYAPKTVRGVCGEECGMLLTDFFRKIREKIGRIERSGRKEREDRGK